MPTKKRQLIPGEIYHIYNRSAGKKTIFHSDGDYNRFILKMVEYKQKFPVDILAYCLMPNHFHLLIRVPVLIQTPRGFPKPPGSSMEKTQGCPAGPLGVCVSKDAWVSKEDTATRFLHRLFTSYAKYYCHKYSDNHSGRLFESPYKSKHVGDDAYYLQLCGYIHDNPVRKKLVQKPEEWAFSSYLALIGEREDGISCDAPELREGSHRQIYANFARDRQDVFDEIMRYI